MQKNLWKDYFTFSKRERNGVFILLAILCVLVALPYLVPAKKLQISIDENLQQQLEDYQQKHPSNNNYYVKDVAPQDSTPTTKITTQLFAFDPNTLDENGFKKLGLSDKVIHTIINYRSKGGRFKNAEDIKKIYGLTNADAERLIPYIKINSTKNNTNFYKEEKPQTAIQSTPKNNPQKININTATAEDFKSLPGIGDVLGNRIVKFRNAIHGFKSIDDVKKTYGLSDSTFNAIKHYLVLDNSNE